MLDEIAWGMIGTGDVTEVKSGPGLYRAQHSRLVGVTNRTLAKAQSWVSRHGLGKVFPDVATLLADDDIDIVYIATPPSEHLALTRQVAAAGKHVYVEKPMAMDAAECEAMISACEAAGVRLFVAYYRRALPRFAQVQQWLAEGAIGVPCSVSIVQRMRPDAAERSPETLPWRLRAEVAGGGKFLDVAVHALDIVDYWLGPLLDVSGSAANRGGLYEVEDTVVASWRHASGVLGTGSWCFVADDELDRIEIVGSAGRIELACFANQPLRLINQQGTVELEIAHPQHIQQPLIQSIVDELRGHGVCPSTAETAARTSRVADAVLQSYRQR